MKVVADTNVYVSAIIFGGKPQTILDLAQDGQIELFISDAIVAEITRILRDKFKRAPEQLGTICCPSKRSRRTSRRANESMPFFMIQPTTSCSNVQLWLAQMSWSVATSTFWRSMGSEESRLS